MRTLAGECGKNRLTQLLFGDKRLLTGTQRAEIESLATEDLGYGIGHVGRSIH